MRSSPVGVLLVTVAVLFALLGQLLSACLPVAPGTGTTGTVNHALTQAAADSSQALTGTPTPTSTDRADPTAEIERTQVEIFSWWTGGGEAAGLSALVDVFNDQHPDIEVVNAAVAGGAGTNARAVLTTRLMAENAPDSWQGHAGQELIGTYVRAQQILPLNDLYEQNGWLEVMPKSLISLISQDGQIYSVPVNIHRSNVLWYNPAVLERYGVDVPRSPHGFIVTMERLRQGGMRYPLAMGEQWTAMHLFETQLLAMLDPWQYNDLWLGRYDWNSTEVTAALENFKAVLEYTPPDAASLTWQDSAQMVINGDAAFTIMGDWVEGYYKELKKTPRTDFGWAPAPGTGGVFQFLSDSFVLPVHAPHPQAAIAWLTLVGSREGQDAFNPVKGSIPARSDADRSLYDVYLQSAMNDWAQDEIVGSLTHGVVANDSWKAEINSALGLFMVDRDVAKFQSALAEACQDEGPCAK